ncbi:hypothetical protein MARINON1_52150 [Marinobacter salarius]|nr:hypothetical protein MBHK15_110595 [Marinobacter salarius]VXC12782.1 hypothetical protein MARINON1_52150 [Marinobacter salarius]
MGGGVGLPFGNFIATDLMSDKSIPEALSL